MMITDKWIYDIELFSNMFLLCAMNIDTKEKLQFEISKKIDNRKKLIEWVSTKPILIGYNNLQYDCRVLKKCIQLKHLPGRNLLGILKAYSSEVINDKRSDFYPITPQIDLMKIHHFDNKAKMTSLKLLEFNMGLENIESLPYPHYATLTDAQKEKVRSYCWNDIHATYEFYLKTLDKLKFREFISEKYGIDATNYNDTKIGEYILIDKIHKATGWEISKIKNMGTDRESMAIKDLIFPYITFNSVEFNTLVDWWKTKTITETKGQFSGLDLEDVKPILPYCNNKLSKGKLKNLNIIYKGIQYDFGTGGIKCVSSVEEMIQ